MSNNDGVLYIVATPIGNLEDMGPRAVRTLSEADLIAAEDTRRSRQLLKHCAVKTRMTALHEHNERVKTPALLRLLRAGKRIALISDAGTPLISDPGLKLVRAAQTAGVQVIPVPGPCAVIAALSAAGLSSDRFAFEGFPPAKARARATFFENLKREPRTLIFFEAPHRIAESLAAMSVAFGGGRQAALARELTKVFETIRQGTLAHLCEWLATQGSRAVEGEFVVLVEGAGTGSETADDIEAERVLRLLLQELPVKQAVNLAAAITGRKRRVLYQQALQWRRQD
ncbi:MAG: 16S rRNA (cytidine(1402)-2'-O)-methyltransferase [Acidiferrobacterales bacterium]